MQHTSPEHDARLLPWIDATGPLPGDGMVDMPGGLPGAAMHACSSQAPAAKIDWQYGIYAPGDSTFLSLIREAREGYDRLMACLLHSDDVRCEVCGDDKT